MDIENIADLEDKFKFRFQIKRWIAAELTFPDREATLSWLAIFLGVAGQLGQARTDGCISLGVEVALKYLGFSEDFYKINESDKIRIKVQLLALGLIRTETLKTVKGGFAEFIILTDRGRARFIDCMVLRKG